MKGKELHGTTQKKPQKRGITIEPLVKKNLNITIEKEVITIKIGSAISTLNSPLTFYVLPFDFVINRLPLELDKLYTPNRISQIFKALAMQLLEKYTAKGLKNNKDMKAVYLAARKIALEATNKYDDILKSAKKSDPRIHTIQTLTNEVFLTNYVGAIELLKLFDEKKIWYQVHREEGSPLSTNKFGIELNLY